MPPLLRMGSAMKAASAPVDCRSTCSKPSSSSRRQSSAPSGVVKRGR
jgi:hypothetical protein